MVPEHPGTPVISQFLSSPNVQEAEASTASPTSSQAEKAKRPPRRARSRTEVRVVMA
jgi:hypothetical protein